MSILLNNNSIGMISNSFTSASESRATAGFKVQQLSPEFQEQDTSHPTPSFSFNLSLRTGNLYLFVSVHIVRKKIDKPWNKKMACFQNFKSIIWR